MSTRRPTKSGRPRPNVLTDDALAAEEAAAGAIDGDVVGIEAKVAELADLQRVHAEYALPQADRAWSKSTADGRCVTLMELLPVLDDIERAREHDELDGAFRGR